MLTIETTLHTFDELSDAAKERARDWWREAEANDFDPEYIYDDAATIADLMGINLRQKPVKLMNGSTRYDPAIYYSGFCSQGDGACFEGSYSYRKGSCKLVRDHARQDAELHNIVDGLAEIQKRRFYRVEATVTHRGNYCHSASTDIDVFDREDNYRDLGDDVLAVSELLRDFMDWIYHQLEAEYNYRMSDEQVDESITCNEYTFDEDGRREG